MVQGWQSKIRSISSPSVNAKALKKIRAFSLKGRNFVWIKDFLPFSGLKEEIKLLRIGETTTSNQSSLNKQSSFDERKVDLNVLSNLLILKIKCSYKNQLCQWMFHTSREKKNTEKSNVMNELYVMHLQENIFVRFCSQDLILNMLRSNFHYRHATLITDVIWFMIY